LFLELDYWYEGWLRGDLKQRDSDTFTLVHGACPTGADAMAVEWAAYRNRTRKEGVPEIVIEAHPPELDKYGSPMAYVFRNRAMAESYPDACVAFFQNGEANKGTKMTVKFATENDVPVFSVFAARPIETVELPGSVDWGKITGI
jgi:hypothetical protein